MKHWPILKRVEVIYLCKDGRRDKYRTRRGISQDETTKQKQLFFDLISLLMTLTDLQTAGRKTEGRTSNLKGRPKTSPKRSLRSVGIRSESKRLRQRRYVDRLIGGATKVSLGIDSTLSTKSLLRGSFRVRVRSGRWNSVSGRKNINTKRAQPKTIRSPWTSADCEESHKEFIFTRKDRPNSRSPSPTHLKCYIPANLLSIINYVREKLRSTWISQLELSVFHWTK